MWRLFIVADAGCAQASLENVALILWQIIDYWRYFCLVLRKCHFTHYNGSASEFRSDGCLLGCCVALWVRNEYPEGHHFKSHGWRSDHITVGLFNRPLISIASRVLDKQLTPKLWSQALVSHVCVSHWKARWGRRLHFLVLTTCTVTIKAFFLSGIFLY